MPFSGILRRVALVRTDISVEHSASFIRVIRIGEVRKTLAVSANRHIMRRNTMNSIVLFLSVLQLLVTAIIVPNSLSISTLIIEEICSSETLGLTRTTRCNMPKDSILHGTYCMKKFTVTIICYIFIFCKASNFKKMPSTRMLRLVALVISYVSEECSASLNRVTRIVELRTAL
jgi:hypothetical protein